MHTYKKKNLTQGVQIAALLPNFRGVKENNFPKFKFHLNFFLIELDITLLNLLVLETLHEKSAQTDNFKEM